MSTPTTGREPQLLGQTVVVIGGSAGIGLETARRARAEGASVILAGRDPQRLQRAATEVGALDTATFDADDSAALEAFFDGLAAPIDHVMVTAGGPYYARLADIDFARARRALQAHPMLMIGVARFAAAKVRPGGALLFMGGTGARRPSAGVGISSAATAALPALTASLAVEVAPVRVNLIAAGFVDTPLSASLLGDQLDARRDELRTTLPIGRVVGPDDVAALAVHLMTNTALTGATYDIDGGQQLLPQLSTRPAKGPTMRSDIIPGGTFPDYELPDHTEVPRKLSELQGDDPLILTLARGHYCPKEHQQHLDLAASYPKIAVAYTQIATIATDPHHTLQEFRASVGAQWPFLSDPGRIVQKDLDIQEYTDPEHDPMIPHTLVLKPGLIIHSVYNGYWFWGRPSVVDLWRDLRDVSREIRPDWDLGAPGLREAWEAGDRTPFHGWE